MIQIRTGNLSEVADVNMQIAEFKNPYQLTDIEKRLSNKKYLALVAEEGNDLVGFKIGYEISSAVFYSWLGGIVEANRGRGIARQLLLHQEKWAGQQHYSEIQVKTRNRHRSMLHLLINHDYAIYKVEQVEDMNDHRIYFKKRIRE